MVCARIAAVLVLLCTSLQMLAQDKRTPSRISKENRVEIVRSFATGLVYARALFPAGLAGLTLKNGQLTPAGAALQKVIDTSGLAAKPGDLLRITAIIFKDDHIRFEINGGPAKNTKWYKRITVAGAGGQPLPTAPKTSQVPKSSGSFSNGSFVDLYFDGYVPDLTGAQIRELLRPVFNFDAQSSIEAYLETAPPKVKEAIQNHHVLVGMNREMVVFAKGLPSKKIREEQDGVEYEEWVYGEPPQDVEFVRIIGDEVVRIEVIKISGEKIIRTEKETDSDAVRKDNQPN